MAEMPSPDRIAALQRHTLRVVVLCQVFGGAGLAAGITVGGLLAQQMLGTDSAAGLPIALFTLGSAMTAYVVGRISQRSGRRIGLVAGFYTGSLGAVGVVAAAASGSTPLLFVSFLLYGAGTATNLQARYAGTDLATPATRGRAVSVALVSTTIGAVAGPNLVPALGDLAQSLDLPRLAGPFLLAACAYAMSGTVLFIMLRPDPLLTARLWHPQTETGSEAGSVRPGVRVGAVVMVLAQIAMVAIMTMTPVHMRAHHHSLGEVGFVIGLHIAAMYLPSLVTGRLVDRFGPAPVATLAGVVLLAAGVVAAAAPADSMPLLTIGLVLLGLGWNLGLISGTAFIVEATDLGVRARTQGSVDVLIALAGAGGGALSGLVVDLSSYATLSLGCGVLALVLVPVVLRFRVSQ